jgi:hypothetical protein
MTQVERLRRNKEQEELINKLNTLRERKKERAEVERTRRDGVRDQRSEANTKIIY